MSHRTHISRSKTSDCTQLGINHIKIRNDYSSWISVSKNIGVIYKKEKKRIDFHPLLSLVSREIFHTYFNKTFTKRGKDLDLPPRAVLEQDEKELFKRVCNIIDKRLQFKVIGIPQREKKLLRLISAGVAIVSEVVLVRPLGRFVFYKSGDQVNPKFHILKNIRGTLGSEESLRKIEKGNENSGIHLQQCVYPSYQVENKVFEPAGIKVKKITVEDVIVSKLKSDMKKMKSNLLLSIKNERLLKIKKEITGMKKKMGLKKGKKNLVVIERLDKPKKFVEFLGKFKINLEYLEEMKKIKAEKIKRIEAFSS